MRNGDREQCTNTNANPDITKARASGFMRTTAVPSLTLVHALNVTTRNWKPLAQRGNTVLMPRPATLIQDCKKKARKALQRSPSPGTKLSPIRGEMIDATTP